MTHIRLLHSDGRLVAVNKNGIWQRLEGVGSHEFGQALQTGHVEELVQQDELTRGEVVDFAVTLGSCLLIIICGMILFNAGC